MRIRVNFQGRVQGVGFRATARSIARSYPVTGWVRNEPDGSVLLEVQGEEEAVATYLGELKRTMSIYIRTAEQSILEDAGGEAGFEIRR